MYQVYNRKANLRLFEVRTFFPSHRHTMFDRSLIQECIFEFAVISDTHFMLDVAPEAQIEFESRRMQTARIAYALEKLAKLKPEFTLHLGDLVQTFPECPDFPISLKQALNQLTHHGIVVHHLPGNHDVGDKPDPTMPTHAVNQQSLSIYHEMVGHSWQSFDYKDCHFVLLNSQIMNTNLPESETQHHWLQRDLHTHRNKRIFVFTHLPPYLMFPDEPGLGHYDNIDQPDRSWLLDLLSEFKVELLVSGHVHYCFFDHIQTTRFYTAPSPAFTRPGFGHLFCSNAPPDQGRDDHDKLGFYLFRVMHDRVDTHLIRTNGNTIHPSSIRSEGSQISKRQFAFPHQEASSLVTVASTDDEGLHIITRTSQSLPHSPVGLTLESPLAGTTWVPLAWPSAIRQPIRNDYPILSIQELGCRQIRVPLTDLEDPLQNRRLQILRSEGVRIIATCFDSMIPALSDQTTRLEKQIDGLHIQFPLQDSLNNLLAQLSKLSSLTVAFPVSICPLITGDVHKGKQHRRTRIGFNAHELFDFNKLLYQNNLHFDRACCSLSSGTSLWDFAQQFHSTQPLSQIGGLDLLLRFDSSDDVTLARYLAETLFALPLLPNTQLFMEPLVDLDRTMDVTHGLLDTLYNPRGTFHLVRYMNSLLFSENPDFRHTRTEYTYHDGFTVMGMKRGKMEYTLLLPETSTDFFPDESRNFKSPVSGFDFLFDLEYGRKYSLLQTNRDPQTPRIRVTGPALRIRQIPPSK